MKFSIAAVLAAFVTPVAATIYFKEDFNDDPLSFFLTHTSPEFQQPLKEQTDQIRIKYLDYDWSLNSASN